MSLRDRGYKPYDGPRTSLGGRWTVVLRHALRMQARGAGVITMLVLSALGVLVWGVLLYVKVKLTTAAEAQPELAGIGAVDDAGQYVYLFLVKWYGVPLTAFLVALFAGGGVVADDTRSGAFQFYFARPLTREQYLLGKLLAPTVLVAAVALVPALLLAVVRVALARDGGEIGRHLLLAPQALLLGAVESLLVAAPAVALSSLSKSRGLAQGAYAALFLLPWVVGEIFVGIFRSPWPALLSMPALLESVGAALFSYPVPPTERLLPWPAAAAMIVLVVGGSLALLRARLAAVEVVAG